MWFLTAGLKRLKRLLGLFAVQKSVTVIVLFMSSNNSLSNLELSNII
jgi:hypothetical protein